MLLVVVVLRAVDGLVVEWLGSRDMADVFNLAQQGFIVLQLRLGCGLIDLLVVRGNEQLLFVRLCQIYLAFPDRGLLLDDLIQLALALLCRCLSTLRFGYIRNNMPSNRWTIACNLLSRVCVHRLHELWALVRQLLP